MLHRYLREQHSIIDTPSSQVHHPHQADTFKQVRTPKAKEEDISVQALDAYMDAITDEVILREGRKAG